jgi:hypothetical protein
MSATIPGDDNTPYAPRVVDVRDSDAVLNLTQGIKLEMLNKIMPVGAGAGDAKSVETVLKILNSMDQTAVSRMRITVEESANGMTQELAAAIVQQTLRATKYSDTPPVPTDSNIKAPELSIDIKAPVVEGELDHNNKPLAI